MSILDCDDSDPEEEPQDYQPAPTGNQSTLTALRIQVRQFPYLDTFYHHNQVRTTIDSGAIGNMIRLSTVQKLKAEICKRAQFAHQADGSSPLKVIGETKLSFTRGQHVFQFEGLVVENLDVVVLAGTPFMEANDIAVRPAKSLITLANGSSFTYGSSYDRSTQPAARRAVVQGYTGAVGPFEAKVNMGPVEPPQRKDRLPQYARNTLVDFQNKVYELEKLGVFKRPEDINVAVEYLNPLFVVKKSNGGYRLDTAFADLGRYSKPQPSLMTDVDSTLRQIAQWRHIITTDLTSAFYQIPLARESMKYCGVATPFRGIRVYARSAMGMPGSETALEELMCRVLGDLIHEGVVAKIEGDLYRGAHSPEELLYKWKRLLQALSKCNLKLSASKTVINPKCTVILGWIWYSGTLQASPHRI